MPNHLYDSLFAPHAQKDSAFMHLPSGDVLSYAEFMNLAARVANVLVGLGLEVGDRLAVQVEKSEFALALYAACVQSGIVYLPLNTAYTAQELEYFVQNSGAKVLVCDASKADDLTPLSAKLGITLTTLDPSGTGQLQKAAMNASEYFNPVERGPDDLAAILYTSGTTGRSKGAMISHNNLLSNARSLCAAWRFDERDVLLHALPVFHTHGLFVATNIMLLAGGAMIFLPKFDLDAIFAHLPRATSMMGVPTFYTRLLSDERLTKEACAHIRLFVSGSAPLLNETHVQFQERAGHAILERYGMTETNMNTSNPYDGERRPGTVGFPLADVELKITDPQTGHPVGDGEIGQIEVRGANVFQGYWKMPEKTREELRADGFFITGDLARRDKDGYIHIVGRNKDLIISGGYNIYPKEIETLLDEQEGVEESAVVGLPHPDFGETPVAFLVSKSGAQINQSEIEKVIADHLARFKHPKRLIVLEELPRNTMGKVQKNLLREQYNKLFSKA